MNSKMESFVLKGTISEVIRQIKLMEKELEFKEYDNWIFHPERMSFDE